MAEFLSNSNHIITKVEDLVAQSTETLHLLTPTFSHLPEVFSTKLWEAMRRGVKVFIIYREIRESAEKHLVRLQHSRLIILQNNSLNTSAYFNEKEVVLTSHRFFATQEPSIEFGTYFRKTYAKEMYAELLDQFRSILANSMKMIIENEKLISQEEIFERNLKIIEARPQNEEPPPALTKLLTVKEKQGVILKIFARECPDCTVKVEDAERIRLYGKGIVLALSNERIDLIFVHYSALQSQMEEVKSSILAKHPEMKVWVQYNRINLKLEYEKDINDLFFTMREVVNSFSLINS